MLTVRDPGWLQAYTYTKYTYSQPTISPQLLQPQESNSLKDQDQGFTFHRFLIFDLAYL